MEKYIINIIMVLQTRPSAFASHSIIEFALFIEFFFINSKHANDKPIPKKSCEIPLLKFIKRKKAKPKKVKGVKNLFKSHNSFQFHYVWDKGVFPRTIILLFELIGRKTQKINNEYAPTILKHIFRMS